MAHRVAGVTLQRVRCAAATGIAEGAVRQTTVLGGGSMRSTGSRRGLRVALALFLLVDLACWARTPTSSSTRSITTVVDLQDALTAFRSGSTSSSVTSAPAGGAEVPGAATGEPTTAALVAPTTTGASTSSSTPVPSSAPATPKAGALVPPSPGVYQYRTTGGENVSLLGSRHAYPAMTYAWSVAPVAAAGSSTRRGREGARRPSADVHPSRPVAPAGRSSERSPSSGRRTERPCTCRPPHGPG